MIKVECSECKGRGCKKCASTGYVWRRNTYVEDQQRSLHPPAPSRGR